MMMRLWMVICYKELYLVTFLVYGPKLNKLVWVLDHKMMNKETQSIVVYHTYNKESPKKIEYSKVKIFKVISLEEWGNKPHTNKVSTGYSEYPAYNYYDYQEACLVERSPSIPITRTTIIDLETIERIQVAGSSKEEIQKILNEVRRSPASSKDIFQDSQDPYDNEAEFLNF
nr:reverse transcriptase domain, zinc finger, CCHC-type, aspartic peptidase domain protein [Tanacetum cinerariifolium]